MLVFSSNFAIRHVSAKLVFEGPPFSGRTTNLEALHESLPFEQKGELTSIATEGDQTLFFDIAPERPRRIAGRPIKIQLYTIPGQNYYNATRKLVLQGVDGVVFVADSDPDRQTANVEALDQMLENLADQGLAVGTSVDLVFQWNKRDLPNAVPVQELQDRLNRWDVPAFETTASSKPEEVIQCYDELMRQIHRRWWTQVVDQVDPKTGRHRSRDKPRRRPAVVAQPEPEPEPQPEAPSPAQVVVGHRPEPERGIAAWVRRLFRS